MVIREDIERELESRAGIFAVAEGDGKTITLSGLIESESEREKAFEIAASLAPNERIVDHLELVAPSRPPAA
jgi:hypothetical protein